ncbi:uncharacterized protein LOC141613442 [Silene latifolia]|uniref:uncharacterized protein LOC141613442 n=1 Tax=Silene latifolia TaxID=37657 RepID=UPI003D788E3A
MEEVEGERMSRVRCGEVGVQAGQNEGMVGWQALKLGRVKINVDAGVKDGVGVGVGVVCRDSTSKVLWGLAHRRKEGWDPHVAEVFAVLDGLEEAVKAGHSRVMVESDCSQVIEALKRRKTRRSMFSLVLDDILHLCNSFNSVVWSFTSRSNNGIAYELAHVLLIGVDRMVWTDTLPPEVVERLFVLA